MSTPSMANSLEAKALQVRRETFNMVVRAGKGHLGGSFSCTELLVALYYGGILRYRSDDPHWPERDRFILSKAHGSNTLHYILSDVGYYPARHIDEFLTNGSLISGHTDHRTPGIEIAGGSLGHGLGVACGMAFGLKLEGSGSLVFCIIGDGESQEGSIWEAALFAQQRQLGNLVAITDYNGLGSEDFIKATASLEPLEEKWRAFGWEVRGINGHSFEEIEEALGDVRGRDKNRPLMLIAKTVKGRGIACLEGTPRAHHTLPSKDEIVVTQRALA